MDNKNNVNSLTNVINVKCQKTPILIALADDMPILTHALATMLNATPQCKVIIEASNGALLVQQIEAAEIPPDVCLIDISMPVMDGYSALKHIRCTWPDIKVIMLSQYYNDYTVVNSLKGGARACLPKEVSLEELLLSIEEVMYKGYYHTELVRKHIPALHEESRKFKLTDRELEYIGHLAQNLSHKQIAELMQLSIRTIDGYRDNLFLKFNLNSKVPSSYLQCSPV